MCFGTILNWKPYNNTTPKKKSDKIMKLSINTNFVPTIMSESETWKESGAIIYIAITVLVFVFLVLIAVWAMTRRLRRTYSPVEINKEDSVELVNNAEEKEFSIEDSGSEEDIDLYSDKLEDDGPLEAV